MTKVLIVDDEQGYRERIEELLTEDGYAVATAASAENAIAVGLSFRPDLLIVDWMLKGELDGFDVARELRQDIPDLHTILITGYPLPSLESKALGSRVGALVYKPFEPEELRAAVRRGLEN